MFIIGRFWLVITLIALTYQGKAQSPVFKTYSVDEGLPSSEVYQVFQDSKGYMWFGTDGGVCRFDGTNFKTFTTEDGLSDNTIFIIHEDYKQRVWFVSFGGTLSYFEDGVIKNLPINEEIKKDLRNNTINSIYVDPNDTIWLGCNYLAELYKITPNNEFGFVYLDKPNNHGSHIKEIDDHGFVFCARRGIFFSLKKKILFNEKHFFVDKTVLNYNYKFCCIKLINGNFLLAQDNILILLNKNGIIYSRKFNKRIISLYQDHSNRIWVGMNNDGVYCFNKPDALDKNEKLFLSGLTVSSIFQDTEGGMWFATQESGIRYLASDVFKSFTSKSGLAMDKIVGISGRPNGEVIISYFDGRISSISNGSVTHIPIPKYSINNIGAGGMMVLENGDIWYSCSAKIYLIKNKTNKFNLIVDGFATQFYDDNNSIWIGTSGGMVRIFKDGKRDGFKFGNVRVNTIVRWKEKIWFGSLDGLWNLTDGLLNYVGDDNLLLKNKITSIQKSNTNELWITTKVAGVLIKSDTGLFQLSKKDGLVSNFCNALYKDDEGIMWVSTNRGISRIETIDDRKRKFKIDNYSTFDGLLSNEVNQVYKVGNQLWIATSKGVSVLDLSKQRKNNVVPPVYITRLRMNDSDIVITNIPVFSYNENNIQIDFIGVAFKNAGKMQYRYRIQGLSESWIYTNTNSVNLTAIPSGKYKFEVSAMNSDGLWNPKPAALSFIVKHPFWATWWFISSLIVLFVFLMLAIFRYRIRQEKQKVLDKSAIDKKIAELELKALKAQMSPHFTFNTINAIQHFITNHEKEAAHRYLTKFARLIRSVLNHSEMPLITIGQEVDTLNLYLELESMRLENGFGYEIIVDEDIDPGFDRIPPMLLQPYIENAIWHGLMNKPSKGKLSVQFHKHSEQILRCVVEDDGIGRKKAQELKSHNKAEHKSLGMLITKERIELLNSAINSTMNVVITDLENETGEANGTRIEIFIPYQ